VHPSVFPESTAGHEAVDVGMVLHSLSPRMEYGKNSDLYALSCRGLQQCLRDGGEECIQWQTPPSRIGMSVKERPEAAGMVRTTRMNLTRSAPATRTAALAGYPQCSADLIWALGVDRRSLPR
jgi:hypothetical protein